MRRLHCGQELALYHGDRARCGFGGIGTNCHTSAQNLSGCVKHRHLVYHVVHVMIKIKSRHAPVQRQQQVCGALFLAWVPPMLLLYHVLSLSASTLTI